MQARARSLVAGTFDFADMAVGRNNFEMNGNVGADALKFMIGMDVADFESAMDVQ